MVHFPEELELAPSHSATNEFILMGIRRFLENPAIKYQLYEKNRTLSPLTKMEQRKNESCVTGNTVKDAQSVVTK